jgi:hypothetical protein
VIVTTCPPLPVTDTVAPGAVETTVRSETDIDTETVVVVTVRVVAGWYTTLMAVLTPYVESIVCPLETMVDTAVETA